MLCIALDTSTDVCMSTGTTWSADDILLALCCWLTPKPATAWKRKEIDTKDERRFNMIVDLEKCFSRSWLPLSRWAFSVFRVALEVESIGAESGRSFLQLSKVSQKPAFNILLTRRWHQKQRTIQNGGKPRRIASYIQIYPGSSCQWEKGKSSRLT